MRNGFWIFCLLLLVSCGKDGKNGSNVVAPTVQSIIPVSYGIDFEDVVPGLICAAGGVSIFTFEDDNNDGTFQVGEVVVKVKAVCNGTNGSSSSISLESLTSSNACPSGGVKIVSGPSSIEVCNGVDGVNGANGTDGQQGLAGAAGSLVVPVKFCASDNSTYPEYGLMIDGELFAVNWGPTPASPSISQAFLTKLVSGNYMSTGGNNCLFSVP
jgi:hypothetical protein